MKLFAQKEAEAFVKTGAVEFRYNRDIRLTPGAKDIFSEAGVKVVFDAEASATESSPAPCAAASAGASEDEKLFNSPEAERIKKEICDIGRRIWAREYCDGNGGNISARLGPDRFIITPTGVSKGFMTPDMLSMVDIKGNQLAGTWKRSSEFTTHAAIYETTPEAASVCHAHPVHAGAFAIKELQPPARLIPELEVFVGQVAVAGYQTPGSPEIAASIRPLAPQHQSIIMGCHLLGQIRRGCLLQDGDHRRLLPHDYPRPVAPRLGLDPVREDG
jgi:L-fuculose-phosphate aldolase